MTVKEYLSQARHLDSSINCKIEQVESLHDLATKATATLSDMPGSPTRNTHKMENIIIKILMLEGEINADIESLVDLRNEIHSVISAIEDEDYRMLIEKRYINHESWEDIADDMGYGLDSIYKLHGKALKLITLPKSVQ